LIAAARCFINTRRMGDEDQLLDRLRAIEPTFAGCNGLEAADVPRTRLLAIVAELATKEPPVEFQFSTRDFWSLRILLALLRRYGLKPYRYRRQRPTTVMAKISPTFAHEIIVPEYRRFSATLNEYFHGITERIVADVFGGDSGEVLIARGEPGETQAAIDD
jgi:hypothetical protein